MYPPINPPAFPSQSPPALPPALPQFGTNTTELSNSPALGLVTAAIVLLALLLLLLLLHLYCWRRRGIGLLGIIALYPGRATNEIAGILTLGSNSPSSRTRTFEVGRWRPWRPQPSSYIDRLGIIRTP